MKHPFRLAAAAAALLLAGCSGGPSGEYSDKSGMMTYKFKSGGKVEISVKAAGIQQTVEMDYMYEEGKVKVGAGGAMQVIAMDKDGCLEGGIVVGKLCRK